MTDSAGCVRGNPAAAGPAASRHVYRVYGIALHSEIPLPLPTHEYGKLAQIELRIGSASFFSDVIRNVSLEQVADSFYELGRLADGSTYARWRSVGEFLVSGDGSCIVCRQFDVATTESFHVYLLGQALSFAMVKSGLEPFHGTVVVIEGEAVAFLGGSGFGKSSLAASFLEAGHQILTDDVLLFQVNPGGVFAFPGPPRIKLDPKTARHFLGDAVAGVRMNRETEKLILPLTAKQGYSAAVPVKAIYILNGCGPREFFENRDIRVGPLPARQAFLEMLANTFNTRILDANRLERQIHETALLVNFARVRKLWFPRIWAQLPAVREVIMSDLNRLVLETAA